MTALDPHRTLGLGQGASQAEIKRGLPPPGQALSPGLGGRTGAATVPGDPGGLRGTGRRSDPTACLGPGRAGRSVGEPAPAGLAGERIPGPGDPRGRSRAGIDAGLPARPRGRARRAARVGARIANPAPSPEPAPDGELARGEEPARHREWDPTRALRAVGDPGARAGDPRRPSARPATTVRTRSRSIRPGRVPPGTAPGAAPIGRSTPRSTPIPGSTVPSTWPALAGRPTAVDPPPREPAPDEPLGARPARMGRRRSTRIRSSRRARRGGAEMRLPMRPSPGAVGRARPLRTEARLQSRTAPLRIPRPRLTERRRPLSSYPPGETTWRSVGGDIGAATDRPAARPAPFRGLTTSPIGRIALALLAWMPLGVALAALTDALPACGVGLVSVCADPLRAGIWPIHLLLIGVLLAVPRLAGIAASGAVAFLGSGSSARPSCSCWMARERRPRTPRSWRSSCSSAGWSGSASR